MNKRDSCPLCQSINLSLYNILKVDKDFRNYINSYYKKNSFSELSNFIDNEINYMKCNNCNLIYQKNILTSKGMYKLYEEIIDYKLSLKKRLNFSLKHNENSIKLIYKLLKLVNKKPSEVVVVDLGMGFGHMLSYAKALGCINSYGIEVSEMRIKYAKDNFGIKSFDSLDKFKDEEIDFLIANQSLEHIPNIRETLNLIENKIAKNGIVYISVPNGSEKKSFLSKGSFQPLEHINSFIPSSKNFFFSNKMKYKFMLKNICPKNRTTWLFQKI